MSPRSDSSPLRNLRRKPANLTLAVAAATIAATFSVALASPAAAGPNPQVKVAAVGRAPGAASFGGLHGASREAGHGPAHAVTESRVSGGNAAQASQHGGLAAGPSSLPSGISRTQPQKSAHARPDSCHTGSQVRQWVCQAEQIMVAHGAPRSATDTGAGVIVAMHESGGNPRAANGWDSNAAAGTPSEGIAQIIGPGFQQYHLPGHDNIWNPVDNMVAAFRYAIDRYGSMSDIPGVVAVRSGGGYVGY